MRPNATAGTPEMRVTSHPSRRAVLQAGLSGTFFASRWLAGRSMVGRYGAAGLASALTRGLATASPSAGPPTTRTAIILVWLRGGASHLETFDPKPLAPAEYRGPFGAIPTNVTGIHISELLPQLAQMADRYALLRSIAHTGGGHPAGSLQVLSGDPDPNDKPGPIFPDWMSVAHHLRAESQGTLPNYIAVNPVDRYDNFVIAGPAYLGSAHQPFAVTGDPSQAEFAIPGLSFQTADGADRLKQRGELLHRFGQAHHDCPGLDAGAGFEAKQRQALQLLTSPSARAAFDLTLESDAVRDRYGRHAWGQQCLMARRLVEAGVEIVTTELDGPLCGRVSNWDDHAVNHHVFDAMKFRAPYFDQAVSALIDDIYQRGLDRQVLVVVAGEFGRTPRISYAASSGGGTASAPTGGMQPGRDHWPRANTMLFAGGGIPTGQVIGATDARGEDVTDRLVGPGDFLATLYAHLQLHVSGQTLADREGRPVPILAAGNPIPELMRANQS